MVSEPFWIPPLTDENRKSSLRSYWRGRRSGRKLNANISQSLNNRFVYFGLGGTIMRDCGPWLYSDRDSGMTKVTDADGRGWIFQHVRMTGHDLTNKSLAPG